MKKATTSAPKIFAPSTKIHSKKTKNDRSLHQPSTKEIDGDKNKKVDPHIDKENYNPSQHMNTEVYHPKIGKKKSQHLISCQNTVSLTINESSNIEQSLLDSLLYEEKEERLPYNSLLLSEN